MALDIDFLSIGSSKWNQRLQVYNEAAQTIPSQFMLPAVDNVLHYPAPSSCKLALLIMLLSSLLSSAE
jgi:hypothetical protein